MEEIKRDDWCFACGEKNPFGLKMEFYWEGEDYFADLLREKSTKEMMKSCMAG